MTTHAEKQQSQAETIETAEAAETLGREDLVTAVDGAEGSVGDARLESEAQASAKKHFEALAGERAALPADRLATPFLVMLVVKFALGLWRTLQPYLAEVAGLKDAVPERLRVRERALALWHAELQLQYAAKGEARERALADEGKPLRERILADWGAPMVAWGVLTRDELTELNKGRDRDDLASDLSFIGARCVKRWAKLENRVTFTLEDVRRAQVLGEALLEARAVGEDAGDIPTAREDLRRAFTLVVQSVNEFRAALGWTRRDDVLFALDAVCPSIYSVRRPANAKPEPEAPAPDAPADA